MDAGKGNITMNLNLSEIDDLIMEYNEEIDTLRIELDKTRTELSNLKIEKKEIDLKIEDQQKIKNAISINNSDINSGFSPFAKNSDNYMESDGKKEEIKYLKQQQEVFELKVERKDFECTVIMDKIDKNIDILSYLQSIKKSINNQVNSYTNSMYIEQLKEIVQKKRLISLEKNKFSPIVSKLESQILTPSKEAANHMKMVLDFMQSDPVRGRQELDKVYQQMNTIIDKTSRLIGKYNNIEKQFSLCESLNNYIGDIVKIYPEIKFHMTVANLEVINNINIDLNRCLMAFIKGMVNSFILKCSPALIYLRYSYVDGYLIITGKIIGKYINFYNEMKNSPNSVVATMYEKIFLLNGIVNFKNNNDGTFNVTSKVPVKNYLV